ncbi:MAG: hypothetical protein II304_12910 [Bacteroidales bacterium]|nr:hypothetical protein [Bacteroidales bacterium]
METYRITLQEYFNKYGEVNSGLIVKSMLIDHLEIYGFINHSKDIEFNPSNYGKELANIIVDKASTKQIIQSNYMYQVLNIEGHSKGFVSPIYSRLRKSENDIEVDIKQLYIPDLINNTIYHKIRSRYKDGNQPITLQISQQRTLEKYLEISIKKEKIMVLIHKGDILCQDIGNDTIKSIGKEILVVCRYIHNLTGNTCYTLYGLNEITIEDKDNAFNNPYDLNVDDLPC